MSDKKKYVYLLEPNADLLRSTPTLFFEDNGSPRVFTVPKEGQIVIVPGRLTVVTLDDDGQIVSVE